LRTFRRSDGLEYGIAQYQAAQLFLLAALFSGQTFQQPVVLLLPGFFVFHDFNDFRVRAHEWVTRIMPAFRFGRDMPPDCKKPAETYVSGFCYMAIAGRYWLNIILSFCIGIDRD
jgi:hypothetical protein